jgi:RND family efflux transporter MFP subunit
MPDPVVVRRLKFAAVVALAVAVVVVTAGLALRGRADKALARAVEVQAVPTVVLADVSEGSSRHIVLPGALQAFISAPLHARVSGYLKRWYVDIGRPVAAGQLLAEIDTPDLDQQVLQARADLATAEANRQLAQTTAIRWNGLVAQDAVSKQDADEKDGAFAASRAAANSARANLDRLLALESFKRITAPFAGVVTSRATDVGALITVGGVNDPALFTVSDQTRLRVYVNVPQIYSSLVGRGQAGEVTAPEFPGEVFKAVVVSDARAVGPAGGVLVELQLDNPEGRLKTGGYVQVRFALAAPGRTTSLPATAIIFRNAGATVAVVDRNGHVTIRPVLIARDLGARVEVGDGIAPGDRVIDNPPEALTTGDLVRVAPAAAARGTGRGGR